MRRNQIVRGVGLAALAAAVACRDAAGPGGGGEPWGVLVVAGDGQEGAVRGQLHDSVAVRVLDVHRRPVAGTEVRWTVEEGGGSVDPAVTLTSAEGVARTAWTVGPVPATGVLRATAAGRLRTEARSVSRPRVELAVLEPQADVFVNDVLAVRARVVERATVIDSVTATVQGLRARLVRGAEEWTASLPLGALPAGAAQVRVNVHSSTGDTAAATVPFRRHPSLSLHVYQPFEGSVATGRTVPVWADCRTQVQPCTLEVRTPYSTLVQVAGPLRGTVTLDDGDYRPGQSYPITIVARDAGGLETRQVRTVHLELPAGLTVVASAGSEVWDVDADRVLFVDTARTPRVLAFRDRGSGVEQVVYALPAGTRVRAARLHPQGAVFVTGPLFGSELQVFDWRAGRLESLGPIYDWPDVPLLVRGRWMLRNLTDGTMIRRDLHTGEDLWVGRPGHGAVGPNGDVAYVTPTSAGSRTEVYRLRNGVRTLLTTCPVAEYASGCSFPMTDGSRVVVQPVSRGRMFIYYGLEMIDGTGPPVYLTSYPATQPWTVYEADGWIVFRSGSGAGFVAPDGRHASYDGTPVGRVLSGVTAVGPGGVVVSSGTVYRPDYTQPGVTVPVAGRFEFHGAELLLFSGRTVYRVSY